MPMSKFFTLNYLINSYCNGKNELESLQVGVTDFNNAMDFSAVGYEPSQKSIDAILNFASQYEVLKSAKTGNIELNLN
ncbi:MAG: hypothetical protein WC384_02280 [Prolixibacteraceae bacterium]